MAEAMLQAYLGWAGMLREGFDKGYSIRLPARPRSVVVCGMGGSGIVGDFARLVSERGGGAPVWVVKHYRLPAWVRGSEFLVAAVSFSGNTVETLECFRQAHERGATLVAVTGRGRLYEEASEKGAYIVEVPGGPAARAMFPALLGPLMGILSANELLPAHVPGCIDEAVELLRDTERAQEAARSLASALADAQLVLVIAPPSGEPLAWRFKDELNENAKMLAAVDTVPEMGHNGLEAWAHEPPRGVRVLGIDTGVEPDTRILASTLDLLYKAGADTVHFALEGSRLFPKLVWGALVAGLASLELARARGVADPQSTPLIKEFRASIGGALAATTHTHSKPHERHMEG